MLCPQMSSTSQFVCRCSVFRQFCSAAAAATPQPRATPTAMRAWAVHAYNTPPAPTEVAMPEIRKDNQLLVRVMAASVNPIDVRMSEGYGQEILAAMKCVDALEWPPNPAQLLALIGRPTTKPGGAEAPATAATFPLVVGRDCSGQVVECGRAVRNFDVGDQVIAVLPAHCAGTHAEYVATVSSAVSPKPASLSHTEAASLPYVACTAWAALVTTARVKPNRANGLRALIHGGSGGVGTMALQMLRCWGADKVVATCSAEKIDLVEGLGAKPVDYRSETAKEQLIAEGPFELILDCVDSELAEWSDELLGIWRNCVHVSVNSPLLRDTDRYGLPMGVATTGAKLFCRNVTGPFRKGSVYLPAFFAPSTECLNWVSEAAQLGRLRPVIDQVFPFTEVDKAYEKVGQMHGKGKTVIDFGHQQKNTNQD